MPIRYAADMQAAGLNGALDEAAARILREQEELGVDIPTDGEVPHAGSLKGQERQRS